MRIYCSPAYPWEAVLSPRCRDGYANILRVAGRFEDSLVEYEKNIMDFPFDPVSLNGRAQLLKELKSYPESIKTYDLLLSRLPHYEHAKIGKAAVLVILGRFEEAQHLLGNVRLGTRPWWRAQRILGAIAVRKQQFGEALSIFLRGVRESQFHSERAQFQNAIALAKLAMGQYDEAIAAAEQGTGSVAKIISLQSYFQLGDRAKAVSLSNDLNESATPSIIFLRDVIASRYKQWEAPISSEDSALIDQQTEVFLQAA